MPDPKQKLPVLALLMAVSGLVAAVPASAKVPLAEEAHINNSLLAAAVGDVIRKTCPTIYPRLFTFYFKAKALENYARAKGYTEEEVMAFYEDKQERKRMRGLVADYLAANGVVEGDVESYCRLGRAEIEAESLIGSLLGEE